MKKIAYITEYIMLAILGIMFFFCMSACSGQEDSEELSENAYMIYYIADNENSIVAETHYVDSSDKEGITNELLKLLASKPETKTLISTIKSGVIVNSVNFSEDQVYLDFNEEYKMLSNTREILTRAAIVKTLVQVNGINFVSFTINGNSYVDVNNEPTGMMVKEMFVDMDDSGNDVLANKITLFFANETGDKLIPCERTIEYNNSDSIEKIIMDNLIKGPGEGEGYATVNPQTKLKSVSSKDGTCYVNLDETFLTQVNAVSNDVAIYSIVNSLTELTTINKVQIMVNGDSKVSYRDTDLSNAFSRKLDIILNKEKDESTEEGSM